MKDKHRQWLITSAMPAGKVVCLAASLSLMSVATNAEAFIKGRVLDLNGQPVAGAMVTLQQQQTGNGPDFLSVFTGESGAFSFSDKLNIGPYEQLSLQAKALDFVQVSAEGEPLPLAKADDAKELVLVMKHTSNQANTAPASAWLKDIKQSDDKGNLIVSCVNCHQFPTPEARDFTNQVNDVDSDHPEMVRELSWHAMFKYMRFKFGDVIARGLGMDWPFELKVNPNNYVFNVDDEKKIVSLLTHEMSPRFDSLQGYDYGAPLAVNENTTIHAYTVPGENAIREALALGSPTELWAADVIGEKIVRIDAATGRQKNIPVPFNGNTGPHTVLRGSDGAFWLSGIFNSFVGRLDPATEEWKTWSLQNEPRPVPHDLTYNYRNELAADPQGRIWYSDSGNNRVGYFHPDTGDARSFPAPNTDGRNNAHMLMYGITMTSDGKRVCYTQLGGNFGCFSTETLEYETELEFPVGAGPRRMAITDRDTIYIPLFGAGQLVEYDARALKKVATFDLPDRASGPYAATWDTRRKVIWIATSNADVVYRFDPADQSFGVIPLPQPKGYLRMIMVDPDTGHLVTSYANLPEDGDGPRLVVMIDPGDLNQE